MSIDNRKTFINFLRGLAVFFMLWGHSIQYMSSGQFDYYENIMFKLIYSFHMPFFMLLSGYLFWYSEQKRGMIELIEYKSKALLYPIFMCSVVNFFLTDGIVAILKGKFVTIFGGIDITSLWFLWSVLACSISLAIAMKITKRRFFNALFLLIGVFFIAVLPNWDLNIYMYPYFIIGYLYSRNESMFVRTKNVVGGISILGFLIMIFLYSKKHYIYISGILGGETLLQSIQIDLFRWIIGVFGSIAVMWICSLLYGLIKNSKSASIIEKLGQDSLAVYALSMSILNYWLPKFTRMIMRVCGDINWNRSIWVYNLIVTPFVAITYSFLLLIIVKGLKKANAYRLILGRK